MRTGQSTYKYSAEYSYSESHTETRTKHSKYTAYRKESFKYEVRNFTKTPEVPPVQDVSSYYETGTRAVTPVYTTYEVVEEKESRLKQLIAAVYKAGNQLKNAIRRFFGIKNKRG